MSGPGYVKRSLPSLPTDTHTGTNGPPADGPTHTGTDADQGGNPTHTGTHAPPADLGDPTDIPARATPGGV